MGNLTFGKNPTMAAKADIAKKHGYDTGKPSTGSKGPTEWKVKPTASKGKVGITFKKKV
jgi:hypothetical protein